VIVQNNFRPVKQRFEIRQKHAAVLWIHYLETLVLVVVLKVGVPPFVSALLAKDSALALKTRRAGVSVADLG
jgi:hypothetical protein